MQQSDVLGITDAFIGYRSPVREDTNSFLVGTEVFLEEKAPKFIEKISEFQRLNWKRDPVGIRTQDPQLRSQHYFLNNFLINRCL